MRKMIVGLALLFGLFLFGNVSTYAADDPAALAKEILDATGVQGGLVVHLGCGDGRLTAALRANGRYTVHGLQADRAKVEGARAYVRKQDLYGPVSIEHLPGGTLPYVESLVNLIVVQQPGDVALGEVIRVLAPGGTAYIQQGGDWKKHIKTWPDSIDQWTHYLHDASNNAVAHDKKVGPPRQLQWAAPPLWLRSHETPSGIQTVVSGEGRIFYLLDEGLIGITDERLPDRWSIIARDAFNGKLLWKRSLAGWGWRQWSRSRWEGKDWTKLRSGRTDVPPENQRRLVVDGDRLYATLAHRGPLAILDAATGKTLHVVSEAKDTREILASGGTVLVYAHEIARAAAQRRGEEQPTGGRLVAVDGQSGRVLWQQNVGTIRPLFLAIDGTRVVYQSNRDLVCRNFTSGKQLWKTTQKKPAGVTLVAIDGVALISGKNYLESYDLDSGDLLWNKPMYTIGGSENADLFVADGLAWRGVASITGQKDASGNPQTTGKAAHIMALGLDLRTGEEKRRVIGREIRSPEHHHRCYRNKATDRYLLTGMEGIEFVDLRDAEHSQNNWLRGVCRYGILPCNGLIYVPSDQCFCHPGSKILGFTAIKAASPVTFLADSERLVKGELYGQIELSSAAKKGDWPTFRHDSARSGATEAEVSAKIRPAWKVMLGGKLTQPVLADGRVLVAAVDAHTVHCLDAESGQPAWQFTADGRIDSPPTLWRGLVLFGSADGRVYCLRASDGALVWRLTIAPADRRIGVFDQFESVWPVHGSVLVVDGTAYCTAGRSTYLDGGIRVYGLDPLTGKIRYQTIIKGPFPEDLGQREVSFYTQGANSDVLVAEGGRLFMRQKELTLELEQIESPILSSKGEKNMGLHLFSTSGLLDDEGYNRAFWMYSKRWPGFQLANQAPKAGQLLVFDGQETFGVKYFPRRNVHSPMFFPETDGYLLFADKNTTEPQIVGEQGAREPLRWLPQSDYSRGRGAERTLDSPAFGLDKMIGYTRADPPLWTRWLPIRIRGMVKAGDLLFTAGPPDVLDSEDPYAAFEDRRGARLAVVSAEDGKVLAQQEIDMPPVFDGLIAGDAGLFISLTDGSLVCFR